MRALRLAVRLESLKLPFRQAVDVAAQMGFAGVQFDAAGELSPEELTQTGRRQVAHLLRSRNLELAAVGFPARHGFDAIDRLEKRINGAKKVLAMAHDLCSPIVIGQIGRIPEDRLDPRNAHFFDAIAQVGGEADRVGARFAMETGPDSPEAIAKLLGGTGQFGVAVHYDPANLAVRGHDAYAGVRTLAGHIVGTHLKDVIRSAVNISGYLEVPLGEGEMDWDRYFAALAEIEYTGYLTLEREASDRPVEDIAKAVAFLTSK